MKGFSREPIYKKNFDIRNCLPLTNKFLISRFDCIITIFPPGLVHGDEDGDPNEAEHAADGRGQQRHTRHAVQHLVERHTPFLLSPLSDGVTLSPCLPLLRDVVPGAANYTVLYSVFCRHVGTHVGRLVPLHKREEGRRGEGRGRRP